MPQHLSRFIQPDSSFDPETLAVLGTAYNLALADLHDTGQPDAVCEIIAGRIMAAAIKGERDPQRLYQLGLRGVVRRE